MLRGRTLGVAALAFGLALWAKPALAQVDGEKFTPGSGCPAGAVAGSAMVADWDTIFECNGSTQWQRGPYFFGSTSDTCDSNHAGHDVLQQHQRRAGILQRHELEHRRLERQARAAR